MLQRTERQERLYELLKTSQEPVTGTDIASTMGVTRQVVVHDIALLRASGAPILSTPRGYMLQTQDLPEDKYVLSVSHPPQLTATELTILVDYGIKVRDVLVEHPLYGEIRGSLHIASRRDVDLFMHQLRDLGANLLSSLTDGYHLHTVECSDPKRLAEAIQDLRKNGIKVFED